ncbi:hypothetical protein [Candidatus Methylocalor cossyra]|uniref:Lipoprotein n=1 Tax=Candidatus Methylocalor cossyra TaxID=3108543 RepID=A0ABM9NEG8_9GAMM
MIATCCETRPFPARNTLGRWLSLALLSVPLLSGCGAALLEGGTSKSFVDGYNDGCSSGTFQANAQSGQFIKDMARYNGDPEYAHGWQNGERECNAMNLTHNPNNPLEQRDIDGTNGF